MSVHYILFLLAGFLIGILIGRTVRKLVRCRNCKYLNKLSFEHESYACCLTCKYVTLDGFCAWGERK